jgi:hypothetical protein
MQDKNQYKTADSCDNKNVKFALYEAKAGNPPIQQQRNKF